MKKRKKIPKFKNEKRERDFWSKKDSIDYIDWSKAKGNLDFPNLKPSTKTISLRLPESLLNSLKMIANKRDVPYQSFIKIILNEKVKKERNRTERR
ncbi:BrnA antitoxin family protein [bacterium]|nr:BrnA antitoxin family protein [bacterium]